MSDDDQMARQRLLVLTLVRLSGVVLIGLGLLIGLSDIAAVGGMRLAGAAIIVAGTLDAAFAPLLLLRAWRERP